MANITFTPAGSQLDNDAIADLSLSSGDSLEISFSSGDADFARISDLNSTEDKIVLFGFAEQYTLDFLPNNPGGLDAKLIYDSGLDFGTELIAIVENTSPDLAIDDSVFTFV